MKERNSYLFLGLVVIMFAVIVSLYAIQKGNTADKIMSYEEAKAIAEQRIRNDYNFKTFQGHDLVMNSFEKLDDGYIFVFSYDIEDGPSHVDHIEAGVNVINGRGAINYTHTEFSKEQEGRLCENRCGDGVCDEIVCMGEGCPCPETRASCPADCK